MDIHRMNAEIRMLQNHFGQDSLLWHPDYRWVMVKGFPLPEGLNRTATAIVVLIPEQYGYGAPLRDAFIDPKLTARNPEKGCYEKIPHYFKEYPYTRIELGSKAEWTKKGWQYICIHKKKVAGNGSGILSYLKSVYIFLSNPFHDWEEMFGGYE